VLRGFCCLPAIGEEAEHIPFAIVTPPPRVFEDTPIDWETSKADVRCIYWVLDSTTDIDVIFSTVRFAADTVWYPEVARALSPRVLAGLFFDYLLDGRMVHGKSEHASSIGMALASILSIRLNVGSEGEGLGELCERLESQVQWERSSEPTFKLVVEVLKLVARVPTRDGQFMGSEFSGSIPDCLSTTHRLWLSRVVLQIVWRWRCARGPTGVFNVFWMEETC